MLNIEVKVTNISWRFYPYGDVIEKLKQDGSGVAMVIPP
jgi:hypothetical protein